MELGAPIDNLATCFNLAVLRDLPEIPESTRRIGGKEKVFKARRPNYYDVTVSAMFPETWSDTSLGFGGMAGQTITSAYSVIITQNYESVGVVYRGCRLVGVFEGDELKKMIRDRSTT